MQISNPRCRYLILDSSHLYSRYLFVKVNFHLYLYTAHTSRINNVFDDAQYAASRPCVLPVDAVRMQVWAIG